MTTLSKEIYVFSETSIRIPILLLIEIKNTLKFMWAHKRPQIDKAFLSKNNSKNITILDLKLYHRATVRKTMWNWHKYTHRPMEQNIGPRYILKGICT